MAALPHGTPGDFTQNSFYRPIQSGRCATFIEQHSAHFGEGNPWDLNVTKAATAILNGANAGRLYVSGVTRTGIAWGLATSGLGTIVGAFSGAVGSTRSRSFRRWEVDLWDTVCILG